MGPIRWFFTVPLRLRSIFRRNQVERELADELRFHLEQLTDRYRARGLDDAAARLAARREMGGIEGYKEECRDTRRVGLLEDLAADVRMAGRRLARTPTFTVVALLTLALGIGATTTIFTVVDSVLLRSLAYHDPDQLHVVDGTHAPASIIAWQAENRSFDGMAGAEWWTATRTGGERGEEIEALRVSANLFPLLGVPPLLGRWLSAADDVPGRNRVIVLGYRAWQQRFAGAADVIGRTVVLDGAAHTIVGVMPASFRFAPYWATRAEFWAPLALGGRAADRTGSSLRVFGRLKPNVSVGQAAVDLVAIERRVNPEDDKVADRIRVVPLLDLVVGDVRGQLTMLLGAVVMVLLVACGNVAHLQLIRAGAREREHAVQAALGAGRGRLIRQSLLESAVIAGAGSLLGLGLAVAALRLLVAVGPSRIPRLDEIAMSGRVFAFTALITSLVAALAGVGPALVTSRAGAALVLKEGRGTSESVRRRRVRGLLVVTEFAMAMILLVGAGLLLRSFAALLRADPGFDPRGVVTLAVSVKGTPLAEPGRRAPFFHEALESLRGLPGVTAAAAINHLPIHGDNWNFSYVTEERAGQRESERSRALFRIITPGYFRALGTPLVAGRDLSDADLATGAQVVIVNEEMAEREWPGGDPIGHRITVDDRDWFTVIGVAKRIKQGPWTEATKAEMYFPYGEAAPGATGLREMLSPAYLTVVLRSAQAPDALARAAAALIATRDRGVVIADVITLDAVLAGELAVPRFYLLLLALFAGVALVLAAVGIYGVISYSVNRQTREIGLRLAMGATRGGSIARVLREGTALAGLGTLAGLVGSVLLTKRLGSLLYRVAPLDPATLIAVAALLLVVATLASLVPAIAAATVDPMKALRAE